MIHLVKNVLMSFRSRGHIGQRGPHWDIQPSKVLRASCGVLQGSALGPLFLLLCIIKVYIKFYKMFQVIVSPDDDELEMLLQSD